MQSLHNCSFMSSQMRVFFGIKSRGIKLLTRIDEMNQTAKSAHLDTEKIYRDV